MDIEIQKHHRPTTPFTQLRPRTYSLTSLTYKSQGLAVIQEVHEINEDEIMAHMEVDALIHRIQCMHVE